MPNSHCGSSSAAKLQDSRAALEVEVLDNGTFVGKALIDSNGQWSLPISGLNVEGHTLIARILSGDNPVSAEWRFTINALAAPTLVSVRDSQGEVANAGSTTDTAVTVSGKAASNEQVEVFDGATSSGIAAVDAAGDWSKPVNALSLGAHSIKAVAKYGNQAPSNIRTFTVELPVPEFVLDPSSVALNGRLYVPAGRLDILPTTWPTGTTATRTPSSGVPPYVYSSSNTAVATVDANGMIAARQNGNASITVRDSQGRTGSYPVIVSGVTVCVGFTASRYPQAVTALSREGCRMPSLDELRAIYTQYGSRWPQGNDYYWSVSSSGLNRNWVKNLVTGAEGTAGNTTIGGSLCLSTGLR